MANTGFGLRPIRYKDGTPWNGAFNWYYIPASDASSVIGIGDPVISANAGAATGLAAPMGYPQIAIAAAGNLCRGVVIALTTVPPGDAAPKALAASSTDPGMTVYRPVSTAMWAAVVDDPAVVFEIMEDGLTNSLDENDIGKNADFAVPASCDTTTGVSKVLLDSSTAATTAAQLRILRLARSAKGSYALTDNTAGNANVFEVYFNEHEFAQGQTTGTGT